MTALLNRRRSVKLQTLALSRETLANLTADEADMAFGGKKQKPKTKPPKTLDIVCDPPTYNCLTQTNHICTAYCP